MNYSPSEGSNKYTSLGQTVCGQRVRSASRSVNGQNWPPLGLQSSYFQASSRLEVDNFAFALRVPLVTLRAIGLLFLLTPGFSECQKSPLYKFPFLKSKLWRTRGELTADFQVGPDERSLFFFDIKVFFNLR